MTRSNLNRKIKVIITLSFLRMCHKRRIRLEIDPIRFKILCVCVGGGLFTEAYVVVLKLNFFIFIVFFSTYEILCPLIYANILNCLMWFLPLILNFTSFTASGIIDITKYVVLCTFWLRTITMNASLPYLNCTPVDKSLFTCMSTYTGVSIFCVDIHMLKY